MKNNSLKKNDRILIVVILVISILVFLLYNMIGKKEAGVITIKVDGVIQGTYSLSDDQEIEINGGTNLLVIEDGKADMIEADCPDKLCVKQKSISKNMENIICLPNKVIVEVESAEDSEYDAVTN